MRILLTGAAGFIGFHLAQRLLERGDTVVGVDNMNSYYDVSLKEARLAKLQAAPGFEFVRADIADRPAMEAIFARGRYDAIASLAAQAAAVAALLPQDGRPTVLLGHSLGGPVVAQVAIDHPQKVSGLVLLAASLDPALEVIHPMQHVGDWVLVRKLLPRVLRNSNSELLALKDELDALAPQLSRISAKVVIVHGTLDDLVPVANVPFMQARLSGSRCIKTVLLEGRNHFLPWNSQAVVREAIQAALEAAC